MLAVGAGVHGIEPGPRVMVMGTALHAEIAAVPADRVTVLPGSIGLTEAAALPTAWLTAGFGAHETVDTAAHPGQAQVPEVMRLTGGRGADVVLDAVGGQVFAHSLKEAAYGGQGCPARRCGYDGPSITHPGKRAVIPHLDELPPDAATLEAVNTLVFDGDRAIGHNTGWTRISGSVTWRT
ncbi:hypothetical protein GCM10023075_69940 [Streptosporangium album]